MSACASIRALREPGLLALTLGLAWSAVAGTYTWNKTATGSYDWNAAANWTATPSGFPNAVGDVANIVANANGYVTNALNQTVTLGILNLGDTDTGTRRPFRIVPTTAGNALIFDNGSEPAEINQIATSNGDLVAAPVQIANALTVSSATPDRSLTLGGEIGGSGVTLTKTGLGEVLLTSANTFEGLLSVQSGRLVGTAQASGIDDIFVGHIANNPTYSERIVDNRLELAGGACTAAKLTVRANNAIAPVLDAEGLTPLTFTGTATFNAGSWIAPEAIDDAQAGVYTVLTAASVVDNGLALSPETDTAVWSLLVTTTDVKVRKRDPLTLLTIR